MKLVVKQLLKLAPKPFLVLSFGLSYRKIVRNNHLLFRKQRMINNAKKMSKFTQVNFLQMERNFPVGVQLLTGVGYVYGSRVDGDIVEFGTQTASSAAVLATAVNLHNLKMGMSKKSIHFFDSFAGLPKSSSDADNESPHVKSGIWSKNKCVGLTEIEFTQTIEKFLPSEYFKVYPGWFIDSVKTIDLNLKFSMIHIDCDLYESTIHALDYLFRNKLVTFGAHIYFDDYYCNSSNPLYGEQKAWADIVKDFKIDATNLGNYGMFGNSFLINNY